MGFRELVSCIDGNRLRFDCDGTITTDCDETVSHFEHEMAAGAEPFISRRAEQLVKAIVVDGFGQLTSNHVRRHVRGLCNRSRHRRSEFFRAIKVMREEIPAVGIRGG